MLLFQHTDGHAFHQFRFWVYYLYSEQCNIGLYYTLQNWILLRSKSADSLAGHYTD